MLTYHFISIRNTIWDFKQDLAPYPVPSFCSHHLLLNISMKINTFVPKIHLFTRTKGPFFQFCIGPLLLQVSKHNQKQKFYGDFALQNQKSTRKYWQWKCWEIMRGCPKNFRMNKGWLILVGQEMHFCSNVWKKKTQNYRQIFI